MDLAGFHNHLDILKYLDAMVADAEAKDKKAVTKQRQKAHDRAVENVRRFKRLQAETTKKLEKEHDKIQQSALQNSSTDQKKFGTVTSLHLFSDSILAKSMS